MARQRLGVALLVPQPLATQIDGLRRALGDDAYGRIPPHVTLVPPVNVAERDLNTAFAAVRTAAGATQPLALGIGSVSTFAPVNPVAYLAVTGADAHMAALTELRRRCLSGPLDRPQDHEFVPHVTIASDLGSSRLDAASATLADFRVEVTIDRVHVLAEQPGRVWVPIADMPLGVPSSVVGRGSLPLDLTVSGRPDLEAAALLAIDGDGSGLPFTVTARRDGAVVAAAWGWTSGGHLELADLVVAVAHRGQGIGRHLVAAVEDLARRRTCGRVGTTAPAQGAAAALLQACGWGLLGVGEPSDGGSARSDHRRWERMLAVDGVTLTTSGPHRDSGARVLLGTVAAYLPFTLLGYGTDIDVANVLRAGGTFVGDGRYDISRRPGSIVHEVGTGALDWVGGSVAVNVAGVAFAALALWGVLVLAREAGARWAGWAVLLVAVNPWFWLAATSLGDFVWALGFGMAGAVAARRDHRVLAGVLFGLAVGCRLSTVLLALSWLTAERLGDRSARPSWRATMVTAAVLAAGVVAVLVPSWLDAGRSLDFLGHQPAYPGLRVNLGRWAVKNLAVIGVPAGVVLLLGIPTLRATTGRATVERWSASVTVRFAALVVVTGEVLFFRFPWKPVHLLPVVLGVALLVGSSPAAKGRWVGALVAAQLLGGIVGTTIAEPDVPHHARAGQAVLSLTEGALLNDVRCRLDDRRDGPWPDAADPLLFPDASTRSAILFDCQSEAWKAVP